MTDYINYEDTKITNTKSNFDCNINFFSRMQADKIPDFRYDLVGYWKPSTIYATGSPTTIDSNWAKVATNGITSAYRSLIATNMYGGAPGATTSWLLVANNSRLNDPYSDYTLLWGNSGNTVTYVTLPLPADSLYNYNLVICNTSSASIWVNITGAEQNFGGAYRYPQIVATFPVPGSTTINKLIAGLYINGDVIVNVNASNVADSGSTYIRIREVN